MAQHTFVRLWCTFQGFKLGGRLWLVTASWSRQWAFQISNKTSIVYYVCGWNKSSIDEQSRAAEPAEQSRAHSIDCLPWRRQSKLERR